METTDIVQNLIIGYLIVRVYFVDKQLNQLAKEVLKTVRKVFNK